MVERSKDYVVAPHPDASQATLDDWQNVVRATDGVTLRGATPQRLQISATPAALAALSDHFAEQVRIEEISPRSAA
jgi:hypothetical protein